MSGIMVPQYNPVQEEALPSARVPTEAPLAAFGGGEGAQKSFEAAEGIDSQVVSIAETAQKNANRTAYLGLMGDTGNLQAGIHASIKQMRGQDALGAPDAAKKMWKEGVDNSDGSHTPGMDEILERAPNGAVKYMAQKYAERQQIISNRFIQSHIGEQVEQLAIENGKGALEAQATLATQNANDPVQVADAMAQSEAIAQHFADLRGLKGEANKDARDALVRDMLSPLHQGVVESQLQQGNLKDARAYLDDHGDTMNSKVLGHLDGMVSSHETYEAADELYNDVKGLRLADGSPDLAKAHAYVAQNSDGDVEKTDRLWKLVQGHLGEDHRETLEKDQANDRSFRNDVITGQKQGQKLDDALKRATINAKDPLDQQVREEWARQQYAPADVKTDPQRFMNYWRAIHGDKVPDAQIEAKLNQDFLGRSLAAKDWQSLSEQLFERQTKGEDAQRGLVWKQIDNFVDGKVTDKDNREKFKTEMRLLEQQGMQPEEIFKKAQELMKDNPATGWWGAEGPMHDAQYKSDAEVSAARTTNVGQLYEDLGNETVKTIRRDMLRAGMPRFTDADLDRFVKGLGGYEKFKAGSPLALIIDSMRKNGTPLVPANIEWALKQYPDGKVP